MSGPIRVAVLMPACDDGDTVVGAVRSVLAQAAEGIELRLLVIDDGSKDGTPDRVGRVDDPGIRLIRREARGGEAAGLNTGLDAIESKDAPPDWIGIVEADVALAPGWIRGAVDAAVREGAHAVGGRLRCPPESLLVARLAGYEAERKFESKDRRPDHLTSAAVLYRREVFGTVGRFREDLKNASLDSDFNHRARRAGFTLLYEPNLVADHRWKPSLGGWLRRTYAYARFRRAVPVARLYPADREVMGQLAATALLLPAGVVAWWQPWVLVVWAGLFTLTVLPFAGWVVARRRDAPVLLAMLPLLMLRSVTAWGGLLAGMGEATPAGSASTTPVGSTSDAPRVPVPPPSGNGE